MAIRVHSFDFDGCLFHIPYIKAFKKNVVRHNQAFLDMLKLENTVLAFTHIITFVGSARQSKAIDDANKFSGGCYKGSCFPAIKQVSDYIGATLNKLLMADIYGDLPDGTSYDRAMDETLIDPAEHAHWLFDETKATILYAQMQHIANAHPSEKILFDYYDDRQDILSALMQFFTINSELIPKNITLCLTRYIDTIIFPLANIQGKGLIDINYRETVKDMADLSLAAKGRSMSQAKHHGDQIKTHEHVTPALLIHKKTLRKFISELLIIEAKTQPLLSSALVKLAIKALDLLDTLRSVSTAYNKHKIDREAFRTACISAMNAARPELKKSLVLEELLTSLDLAMEELDFGYTAPSQTLHVPRASGARMRKLSFFNSGFDCKFKGFTSMAGQTGFMLD